VCHANVAPVEVDTDSLEGAEREPYPRHAIEIGEPAGLDDPVADRRHVGSLELDARVEAARRKAEAVQLAFDRDLGVRRVDGHDPDVRLDFPRTRAIPVILEDR